MGSHLRTTFYCCVILIMFQYSFGASSSQDASSSQSDHPVPQFGCQSIRNNVPHFTNEEIPGLELNLEQITYLTIALEELNAEFMQDNLFNNVDNFISFYNDYESARPQIPDLETFLAVYDTNNGLNENQNVALLRKIAQNDVVLTIAENIAESMFLAATIPQASRQILETVNVEDYVPDENTIHYYTQVTGVIKIIYKSIRLGDVEGYILLRPDSSWMEPITVMLFNHDYDVDEAPNTGKSFLYQLMPDGSIPLTKKRVCPIRVDAYQSEFPGWKIYAPNILYDAMTNNEKLIGNVQFFQRINEYRTTITGFEHPLIYVGKPFCGYEETCAKYDLMSPYRTIYKRNENGWATFGIYVSLTDGRSEFLGINSFRNRTFVGAKNFSMINDANSKVLIYIVEQKLKVRLASKVRRLGEIIEDGEFINFIKQKNDDSDEY